MILIDIAAKLNYWSDSLVIGAFLTTAAVAVYSVALRLTQITQRLTNQLNEALFPVIVDHATGERSSRLQTILLHGTRLSLVMVVPITTVLLVIGDRLILGLVGQDFAGSVPILYVLAASVAVKVGTSTARTTLKGADRHRLLAAVNVSTGIVNLALSIALVRSYGLMGVALGTLIPVSASCIFVLFPAACRRAGLTVGRALAAGVWPALWPATVMSMFLLISRSVGGHGLIYTAVQGASAVLLYGLVYMWFAIGAGERQWYFQKARHLLRRPRTAAAV
jgi:O-antigen/teichoic acid export membrane protein